MNFKDIALIYIYSYEYICKDVYIFTFSATAAPIATFSLLLNLKMQIANREREKWNNKHAKEKLNCDRGNKRCVFTEFSLRKIYEIEIWYLPDASAACPTKSYMFSEDRAEKPVVYINITIMIEYIEHAQANIVYFKVECIAIIISNDVLTDILNFSRSTSQRWCLAGWLLDSAVFRCWLK